MTMLQTGHLRNSIRFVIGGLLMGVVILSGCGESDLSDLRAQLSDKDASVRKSAAKQLEAFGAQAAPAVEDLAQCLSDSDPQVRYRAAKALSKIGQASEPAMDELAQTLASDEDRQTRYYAAKALDQFPAACQPAIDSLVVGLSDDYSKVRYYCVKVLGKLGPEARVALGKINQLTRDPDESVRKAAASAIRRIDK